MIRSPFWKQRGGPQTEERALVRILSPLPASLQILTLLKIMGSHVGISQHFHVSRVDEPAFSRTSVFFFFFFPFTPLLWLILPLATLLPSSVLYFSFQGEKSSFNYFGRCQNR